MFNFNTNKMINPEMAKYIREQTNKSLEKYLVKNTPSKLSPTFSSDLVIYQPSCCIFLPFIICFSFLAGYQFKKLTL
jgi:hypothetical protein